MRDLLASALQVCQATATGKAAGQTAGMEAANSGATSMLYWKEVPRNESCWKRVDISIWAFKELSGSLDIPWHHLEEE